MAAIVDFFVAIMIAGTPLIGVEIVSRLLKIEGELPRKLTHVLSCVATAIIANLYSLDMVVSLSIVFGAVMIVARFLQVFRSLYQIKRSSYGEIAFVVGIGVSAFAATDLRVFLYALSCLAVVDTAAYIVGSHFGKIKLLRTKTLEGSTAALVVAVAVTALTYPEAGVGILLTGGLVVAIAELVGFYGMDNITVPGSAILVADYVAGRGIF